MRVNTKKYGHLDIPTIEVNNFITMMVIYGNDPNADEQALSTLCKYRKVYKKGKLLLTF